MKRNNMGLGGFRVEASASVRGGAAFLSPTEQRIDLTKPAPDAPPRLRRVEIRGWDSDPPKGELLD